MTHPLPLLDTCTFCIRTRRSSPKQPPIPTSGLQKTKCYCVCQSPTYYYSSQLRCKQSNKSPGIMVVKYLKINNCAPCTHIDVKMPLWSRYAGPI